MKIKTIYTMIILILCTFIYSSSSQTGTYTIPEEMEGEFTTGFLDTLRINMFNGPVYDSNVNYTVLGQPVWYWPKGEAVFSDTSKFTSTFYNCFENGWTKIEYRIDTATKEMDYQTHTPVYNLAGNGLWSSTISTILTDSTQITFNSSIDVTVKIFIEYNNQPVNQFTVVGNSVNHNFSVSLQSNKKYAVVFINEDEIVYIKRIEV